MPSIQLLTRKLVGQIRDLVAQLQTFRHLQRQVRRRFRSIHREPQMFQVLVRHHGLCDSEYVR